MYGRTESVPEILKKEKEKYIWPHVQTTTSRPCARMPACRKTDPPTVSNVSAIRLYWPLPPLPRHRIQICEPRQSPYHLVTKPKTHSHIRLDMIIK